MFLVLTTSKIVDFKVIRDVLGLTESYQCGVETPVPVAKHSVSDSMVPPELSSVT